LVRERQVPPLISPSPVSVCSFLLSGLGMFWGFRRLCFAYVGFWNWRGGAELDVVRPWMDGLADGLSTTPICRRATYLGKGQWYRSIVVSFVHGVVSFSRC